MADFPNTRAGTLAPATPASVDFNTEGKHVACLVLSNTGANPLTTTAVYKSPLANLYAEDPVATAGIGTIAPGVTRLVELADMAFDRLRLTMTSTLGTTYTIECRSTP